MNDATGPLFEFGLGTFLVEEPLTYCRDLAREQGLVFFDPESADLLR
jgi:hypothetical protein